MRFRVFILLLLFAGTFPSAVIAQDDAVEEGKNRSRGGALRLGAF